MWTLISIGKLKNNHLLNLENDFLKRLTKIHLKIIEIKAQSDAPQREAASVINYLQQHKLMKSNIVLLKEQGQYFDSLKFADWLAPQLSRESVFVLGGAMGHGEAVLQLPSQSLSLSPLTFPHQFARVLLIEQFYRAQSIWNQHPYHNE